VGYEVQVLRYEIERKLGLTTVSPVVIVGLGNLGQALANYGGFRDRGFPIVALVDADPAKVGITIGDIEVRSIDDLPALVGELGIAVGIIATPARAAQGVADQLVGAGVRSILNFAPVVISVPDHVPLRKVDLATELQILSFYQQGFPLETAAPHQHDDAGLEPADREPAGPATDRAQAGIATQAS
jgi:redox-sensing transcriptional repressor